MQAKLALLLAVLLVAPSLAPLYLLEETIIILVKQLLFMKRHILVPHHQALYHDDFVEKRKNCAKTTFIYKMKTIR